MTEENQLANDYRPKQPTFREIVKIPGLASYKVKTLKSLPGRMIKITCFETLETVTDPVLEGNKGTLCLLNKVGITWEQRDFTFESYEVCPFDLDYAEDRNLEIDIYLKGVEYGPIQRFCDPRQE